MKFDLFYELMVPVDWTDDIERRVYAETIDQLVQADLLGYDTAWVARHHGTAGFSHTSSPEAILGAVAARTSRIRLGFGVELLPLAHPIDVAERIATVDLISNGRVDVGTGRSMGPMESRLFGVSRETTRARWLESIRLLPRLWTENDVEHRGKFWSWDGGITVVPRVVQAPHPPLWVAASSNETAELAGQYGLGMLHSSFRTPQDLAAGFALYKAAIADPQDRIGSFVNNQASLVTAAVCHEAGDHAMRERARTAVLDYLGKVRFGYTQNQGAGASINRVSDTEAFDSGVVLVGDPDFMIRAVDRAQALGADRMMLLMQLVGLTHEDVLKSLTLFATQVMPRFT